MHLYCRCFSHKILSAIDILREEVFILLFLPILLSLLKLNTSIFPWEDTELAIYFYCDLTEYVQWKQKGSPVRAGNATDNQSLPLTSVTHHESASLHIIYIPDPEIVNGREKRIVPKQETILTIGKGFDKFVSK